MLSGQGPCKPGRVGACGPEEPAAVHKQNSLPRMDRGPHTWSSSSCRGPRTSALTAGAVREQPRALGCRLAAGRACPLVRVNLTVIGNTIFLGNLLLCTMWAGVCSGLLKCSTGNGPFTHLTLQNIQLEIIQIICCISQSNLRIYFVVYILR